MLTRPWWLVLVALTACGGARTEHRLELEAIAPADERGSALPRGVTPLSPLPLTEAERRAFEEMVGDARVVLLGESSHGAGNAFSWRAAIVALLHEELGFDHLVMESSFYECRRAWTAVARHRDPVRLGRQCAFDIWAVAREAAPLFRHVAQSRDDDRPLRLWGMDSQLSGDDHDDLLAAMTELAERHAPGFDAELLRHTLVALRDDEVERTDVQHVEGAALLMKIREGIASAPRDAPLPSEDRGFWLVVLDSLIATEEDYWLFQQSGRRIDAKQHNIRERQMATNMRYLLERHPNDRFVVWLHTTHAARGLMALGVVDHGNHQHDFSEMTSFGEELARALDPDPLVMAVMSSEGRWRTAGKGADGTVPPQPEGDLCDRLDERGLDRVLIDLRVAQEGWPWLRETISAPILGPEPSPTVWPEHVNALLYDRVMTPATPR
ncbi:MAG: erythromycin esterase family protein [Polyangiaceae bacterium]